LGIEQEYRLHSEKVHRNGQLATKVHVDIIAEQTDKHDRDHHHHHPPARHLPEIERLIQEAALPPRAKEWSLKIFYQLAIAEGAVHGVAPEKVHFHEVGATDAIVDIVGTCLGLDWLGIDEIYCSSMPTGGGTVKAAHGRLPVPVPAVMRLWEMGRVPLYSNQIDKELVTPTGAAIAVTLATQFGTPPKMQLEKIGLGAGSQDLSMPNILRLWIGSKEDTERERRGDAENRRELETIAVLETQIDDLNPQAIGYVFEALFQVGALDVFTTAIAMKKSRPGILLTVICSPEKMAACEDLLFRETTTLGIRRTIQERSQLKREIQQVETVFGTVRIKIAFEGDGEDKNILNIQPEYEDCAELARLHQQPWRNIHQMAIEAFRSKKALGSRL
jgi:pyridinium-3,5-bisthiocarboxylic acid mononucleotide nickel chelatase